MIVINRLGDVISISYNGEEKSVMYTEEKMTALEKIAKKSETVSSMENLKLLIEDLEAICSDSEAEMVEDIHPNLYKSRKTGKYYLKLKDGAVSSVEMPLGLVRRIEESVDKGINIDPLMKCWQRFLKNPKASNQSFAEKFFAYIDMKYVRPDVKQDKLDEGYSEAIAIATATTYQVKITNEGLINCYKVSTEVDWKYEADEEGNPVRKQLYERTFDAITGEITGSAKDDLPAEDRVFIPAVMGMRGDTFYCEGGKGNGQLGHQIRVGATHRLPDWSYVDCNDDVSCRKGLHVGGLYYISCYSGEIHNVFVDPMHIGAIPDSTDGAIRCLEYFVHSSLVAVNDSIYHSSKYAKKTDEQWKEIRKEILADYGKLIEEDEGKIKEIKSL